MPTSRAQRPSSFRARFSRARSTERGAACAAPDRARGVRRSGHRTRASLPARARGELAATARRCGRRGDRAAGGLVPGPLYGLQGGERGACGARARRSVRARRGARVLARPDHDLPEIAHRTVAGASASPQLAAAGTRRQPRFDRAPAPAGADAQCHAGLGPSWERCSPRRTSRGLRHYRAGAGWARRSPAC